MGILKSRFLRTGLQVLVVLWAVYIILLYYIDVFKLIENYRTSIPIIAWSLWNYVIIKFLWVIGFAAVGYGLGRAVLDYSRLSKELDTVEDDLLFSLAVGWGILGLGAFFLGSIGVMNRWVHLGIALVVTAACYRQILGFVKSWMSHGGRVRLKPVEWLITICIWTVVIWGLGLSFIPEYGFDALNSHLPAAKQYIEDGRIGFHPEINFNNFPQTVEMWFMESMMWIPEAASTFLMMACHLLVALIVYVIGRRYFSRGAGMSAALVYLLLKNPYFFATVGFIDQGLAFMLVLGMYGFLRYLEKPSLAWAILVGIVLGFACGMKYSAFITAFLLLLLTAGYTLIEKRKFVEFLKHFGIAALVLLAICSPWYIRNIVWFQNPFFPFFTNIFHVGGGTYGDIADELVVDHREMLHMFALQTKNPIFFIVLPFTLAFGNFGPYDTTGGAVGIIPLLTLPLAGFVRRTNRAFWAIVILTVITFGYWWFIEGMIMLRYMMPILSMVAVISGYFAWEGLRLETVEVKGIIGWVVMAAFFTFTVSYFTGVVTPPTVRGQMPILQTDRDLFVQRLFPAYPAVKELNARFEHDGIIDDVRVYGFAAEQYRWRTNFTLIGSRVGYANYEDYLNHAHSAEELYTWLRTYDIDYLIIDIMYGTLLDIGEPTDTKPDSIDGWALYYKIPSAMDGFNDYFEEISFQNYLFVYRLR